MTAPVDVLAVLDSLIEYHDTSDSLKGRNCIAARAAVAELIEECERLCEAAEGMRRNAEGMARKSPIALTLRTAAANILSLRSVLDNVGSEK